MSGFFPTFFSVHYPVLGPSSIDTRASNDDGRAMPAASTASSVHAHRKFSPDHRTKRKPKRVPWGISRDHHLMSADVVSLVSSTDQNCWNQWLKVSVQGAVGLPRHCSVSWIYRPWQVAAGKKISYERDREKKMHSKSDSDNGKKLRVRVLLSGWKIHHYKDSITDLTRPGSLPCEELQSYPSSKRRENAKFVLPRKSGKVS